MQKNRRLLLAAALVFLAGLVAAAIIYVTAPPQAENPLGYDPMETKAYLREMEMYGGQANVLATQFRLWFDGLWQGRELAFTVAVLSSLAALALWFAATHHVPEDPDRPAE